jgi:hypothetical protein
VFDRVWIDYKYKPKGTLSGNMGKNPSATQSEYAKDGPTSDARLHEIVLAGNILAMSVQLGSPTMGIPPSKVECIHF